MARPMTREAAPADLAVIVAGKPKGGRMPPGGGMSDADDGAPMMGGAGDHDTLPPGFESAAGEAFPDMDPSAYPALKRLIGMCMDEKESY